MRFDVLVCMDANIVIEWIANRYAVTLSYLVMSLVVEWGINEKCFIFFIRRNNNLQ